MEERKNVYTQPEMKGNAAYKPKSNATYNAQNEEIHEKVTKYRVQVRVVAYIAFVLSILSFFIWPYVLGPVSIIAGFIAQRKGEITLGAWSICLGALAIVLEMFIF
ncbi:hypothetical protein [Bacillus sp. 1P06AnD]|uniref:hypothetical protein n=1 Tax=Bacillus sp. 1P06AnD TaxID=3132208 RepID=UPI0039A23096